MTADHMGLRGNLFVKIFIGFWLVTTAILVSWMLSSHYFDSRAGDAGGEVRPQIQRHAGPPHRFVLRTLDYFQHMSDEELGKMIAENRRQHGIDVFLIRRDGSELFGLEVPPDVSRMAASLAGGKRRAAAESRGKHLLAHRVYRENEGLLRAVFVFPRPARGLVRALGEHLWLRIALAVAISGLVCFALSRLMTNRLKELGQASRRLAEGDLDTRLAVRDHGGDETDELARDFNTMAAQLQERIDAQKRLLGDVSHELRSPLARLRVALALAEDDPDNLRSHLQRIERETERLDELIDQLLSTRAGEISLDTHIDLVALLQQLCADAGFEGEAGGVRVLFNTELEQAVIPSSGDLLHKSFENILRNALAHTVPGTEITVELQPEDNEFLVSVEDQGPGVPAEELERIFGEFYRVDTARSRESGGYGLGLAIARRAILRHGGRIGADNTGNGLRVTVSLPIEAPAEDAIP
jgi:two-component system sensor histidine kinase CpxA